MDLMMRNGVLGTVLCLVGLQSSVDCQLNWKNSKVEERSLTAEKLKYSVLECSPQCH